MRKHILILMFLIIPIATLSYAEHKAQEFQVTYSITYNNLTLEEASDKEKYIKEAFPRACEIRVKINETVPLDDSNALTNVYDIPYAYDGSLISDP